MHAFLKAGPCIQCIQCEDISTVQTNPSGIISTISIICTSQKVTEHSGHGMEISTPTVPSFRGH